MVAEWDFEATGSKPIHEYPDQTDRIGAQSPQSSASGSWALPTLISENYPLSTTSYLPEPFFYLLYSLPCLQS